jgi:hypothetical protein
MTSGNKNEFCMLPMEKHFPENRGKLRYTKPRF